MKINHGTTDVKKQLKKKESGHKVKMLAQQVCNAYLYYMQLKLAY